MRRSIDAARGAIDERRALFRRGKVRRDEALREAEAIAAASALLNSVVESERSRIGKTIETLVQSALMSVFPFVAFRLNVAVSGAGVVTMTPEFGYANESGGRVWRSASDVGGGVLDVAAFAARVAVLLLATPARPRVLILDEPFKHVSIERLPAVCAMVRQVSESFGVQFIIVAHEQDMADAAHKVYRVTRTAGVSDAATEGSDGATNPA